MRIAVIAAGGVNDFGLTFAGADTEITILDRGTPLTVTQASGMKPSRRTNALIELGWPASFIIPTAVTPCASNPPA